MSSAKLLLLCVVFALCVPLSVAQDTSTPKQTVLVAARDAVPSVLAAGTDISVPGGDRVSAVIYPLQSATIGTEVRGIIDLINFKEGEAVKDGDVVAEVSKARYTAVVGEFKGNYDAVVRTLERAREELSIQEQLWAKRATTYDEVMRAKSQIAVLEARVFEAEHKLKQAELNLKACIIRAPFSGTISVLYHQPFEAVDNLEKIFGTADTKKVYARANWPEARIPDLSIGRKAQFVYDGKRYEGSIDKVSSLIDPAAKTKQVWVVIDNPENRLLLGMSGALELPATKVSQERD